MDNSKVGRAWASAEERMLAILSPEAGWLLLHLRVKSCYPKRHAGGGASIELSFDEVAKITRRGKGRVRPLIEELVNGGWIDFQSGRGGGKSTFACLLQPEHGASVPSDAAQARTAAQRGVDTAQTMALVPLRNEPFTQGVPHGNGYYAPDEERTAFNSEHIPLGNVLVPSDTELSIQRNISGTLEKGKNYKNKNTNITASKLASPPARTGESDSAAATLPAPRSGDDELERRILELTGFTTLPAFWQRQIGDWRLARYPARAFERLFEWAWEVRASEGRVPGRGAMSKTLAAIARELQEGQGHDKSGRAAERPPRAGQPNWRGRGEGGAAAREPETLAELKRRVRAQRAGVARR